jgi:hypothetical protein
MNRQDLIAVEKLIWRRVLAVSKVVEGFQVIRDSGLPEDCEDVEVNREGEGSLSWVLEDDGLLEKLASIAVGTPQGDSLQLALDYNDHRAEPVTLRMMGRSNWSKAWYPISQMAIWPGEVLLEKSEELPVLKTEVDFYSVLAFDESRQQFRVLRYREDEQPLHKVMELAKSLQDAEFQRRYFNPATLKERMKHPRLDSDEPLDHRPQGEILLVPYIWTAARKLPRSGHRLYEGYWVHRLVNTEDPIMYARNTNKNLGD